MTIPRLMDENQVTYRWCYGSSEASAKGGCIDSDNQINDVSHHICMLECGYPGTNFKLIYC